MIDTFHPLKVTTQASKLEDADYGQSWLDDTEHPAR